MADKDKKALDLENLEVSELEDKDLEDVAGGTLSNERGLTSNSGCPTTNVGCS